MAKSIRRRRPLSHSTVVSASKHLHFQFQDLEQQRLSATLGMWIFLATEVLFFGALFTGYLVFRTLYPVQWMEGSRETLFAIGTTNTAILICSSLTMALAVHAAQMGKAKQIAMFMGFTLLLATTFLGLKGYEYYTEYLEHHVPGASFSFPTSADPHHVMIFYSFYFIMTGLHAIHITAGMLVGACIAFRAWRGHYTAEYHVTVDNFGLYWHFVDVIWIFLYPLIYLVAQR